jgi:hypothetical protein
MKFQSSVAGFPALVVAGALLSAALPAAWGANADVTVTVTAVPTAVTLSRLPDLQNFGAVQALITVEQNNVINGLVFTSRAKVVTAEGTPPVTSPAVFKESIPAGACLPNTAGDTVTCSVEQARGVVTLPFVLIYESPAAGLRLQYDWQFSYSQPGSAGSNSSLLKASSGQALATLTEVGSAEQQKFFKGFAPPSTGATFFTGNRSAKATDRSTTTLTIPPGLGLTNAITIEEDDGVIGGLTNDTLTTNTTSILIPFTGLYGTPVSWVWQRDASTIRNKTQNAADRMPIYYTSTTGETWQVENYELKNCGDTAYYPTARGPSSALPVCVDERIFVKNNMLGAPKPGGGVYTADDLSDILLVLKALQNGIGRW